MQLHEQDFTQRKLRIHLQQCDILERNAGDRVENSKLYGVSHRSILLELKNFDHCRGVLLPHTMHDLLEGFLQYESKLVLQHCIMEECYRTYSMFSQSLEGVELGYMEIDDLPTHITRLVLTSTEKNLGQKSTLR